MDRLFNVSSSPHVRSKLSTGSVMLDVIIALMPAAIMGCIHFGTAALITILASVCTAVLTEFVFNLVTKRRQTVGDCSAMLTGLLLALVCPPKMPLYTVIFGAAFAVFFAKSVFGGLGKNFMNPALAGRCFMLISFGSAMTKYTVDGITQATPLADMAAGKAANIISVVDMYVGRGSGVIGNSTGALLIGAAYLWMTGGISMDIPVSVIVSFTAFVAIFGGNCSMWTLLAHIFGGGIVLGAFFMATDPVTSPMTKPGKIIFGCVVGIVAGIFRVFGNSPDSTSYAIIFANLLVPVLDRYVVTKPYGFRKKYMKKVAMLNKEGEK